MNGQERERARYKSVLHEAYEIGVSGGTLTAMSLGTHAHSSTCSWVEPKATKSDQTKSSIIFRSSFFLLQAL